MIMQPAELTFNDKKFSMIIYGSPGLGKTTLALSAPDPVLIDFDRGISRVKSYHRRATMVCATYEEVLTDIQSDAVKECQTLIIDTGGSFITYLQDWAMRDNPTLNRQKNGTLSLKGFGAVKQEFNRFTNFVRDTLNKNLIYVFHSVEEKDKDGNPMQRLLCEGAAKNLVWQPCDFGAYMQMIGNKRVLCFTPEQEYFAKGCYGIQGMIEVPNIGLGDDNDFLTRIFAKAKENIEAEDKAFEPIRNQYEKVMEATRTIVNAITTAEQATDAANTLPKLEHALTSKKEASAMLKAKADELGFVWDREKKTYTAPGAPAAPDTPENNTEVAPAAPAKKRGKKNG